MIGALAEEEACLPAGRDSNADEAELVGIPTKPQKRYSSGPPDIQSMPLYLSINSSSLILLRFLIFLSRVTASERELFIMESINFQGV